ncbi:hypothetical protein PR048_028147 [Dryococelus australis]|uniref:Uncharacterized protein n=1 Tax=Dryococelus australis TaxID=614101 RepID=A0ABQ9GIF4_9NEOP|nr:hypothetical protein PR048_028147 [Dryococelus australis]
MDWLQPGDTSRIQRHLPPSHVVVYRPRRRLPDTGQRRMIGCKAHCCVRSLLSITEVLCNNAGTQWIEQSPPATVNRARLPPGSLSGFRTRESGRTIPLVGWFSRGTPVFPALAFRLRSIPFSASQDSAAQCRLNLSTLISFKGRCLTLLPKNLSTQWVENPIEGGAIPQWVENPIGPPNDTTTGDIVTAASEEKGMYPQGEACSKTNMAILSCGWKDFCPVHGECCTTSPTPPLAQTASSDSKSLTERHPNVSCRDRVPWSKQTRVDLLQDDLYSSYSSTDSLMERSSTTKCRNHITPHPRATRRADNIVPLYTHLPQHTTPQYNAGAPRVRMYQSCAPPQKRKKIKCHGGLAGSLLASLQGDPGSIPGRVIPNFRMWESCQIMLLVGGSLMSSPESWLRRQMTVDVLRRSAHSISWHPHVGNQRQIQCQPRLNIGRALTNKLQGLPPRWRGTRLASEMPKTHETAVRGRPYHSAARGRVDSV